MTTYSVKKGQQNDLILFINDLQSVCPFVQAIPMQGNMGQVQIMRLPCTSVCPMVELGKDEWTINCSSKPKTFKIQDEPKEEKPTLVLV